MPKVFKANGVQNPIFEFNGDDIHTIDEINSQDLYGIYSVDPTISVVPTNEWGKLLAFGKYQIFIDIIPTTPKIYVRRCKENVWDPFRSV